VQVGTTDARGGDTDDRVALVEDLGIRDIFYVHLVRGAPNEGFHGLFLLRVLFISRFKRLLECHHEHCAPPAMTPDSACRARCRCRAADRRSWESPRVPSVA